MTIKKTEVDCVEFEEGDCRATISMNPRESMVFCTVKSLSENQDDSVRSLRTLNEILYKRYGGKTFLQLPGSQYFDDAVKAGFPANAPDPMIPTQSAVFAIRTQRIRENLLGLKKRFSKARQYFDLVSTSFLEKNPGALYQFKKDNAPEAVTIDKEREGRFSPHAEAVKMQNPCVSTFALMTKPTKDNPLPTMLGCASLTRHGDWLYLSDFIMKKADTSFCLNCCRSRFFRNNKIEKYSHHELRELLSTWVYEQFVDDQNIAGVWFMAPKWLKWAPEFIYKSEFPAEPIDLKKLGVIVNLCQPGPELLKAANRSLTKPHHCLDDERPDKEDNKVASSSCPM